MFCVAGSLAALGPGDGAQRRSADASLPDPPVLSMFISRMLGGCTAEGTATATTVASGSVYMLDVPAFFDSQSCLGKQGGEMFDWN